MRSDATATTGPSNEKLFYVKTTNCRFDDRTVQALYDKDTDKEIYFVQDLIENPEDAIIGRELVDVYQMVAFINYGIDLGRKGYTSASIEEVFTVEENDIW